MAVDDVMFTQEDIMDPYRYQPQRQGGGAGLIKSVWKGLKKLSGFQSTPYNPRRSSYGSQSVEMPVPGMSMPSEATQYGNTLPSGTDEQHVATPYTSPYARPANLRATPAVVPGSLRASPVRMPSVEIAPPITVVSPSVSPSVPSPVSPSPLPSLLRSVRMASPATGMPQNQNFSARGQEPIGFPIDEGSQTLHEPVPNHTRPPLLPALVPFPDGPKFPIGTGARALDSPSPSKGSLSTMARVRRFITELDDLPWVSDTQIAHEYVPEQTPRSQMRRRVRQGAEPSWYNARPEPVEQPEHWSEWDMWAKQSTALLWDDVGVDQRRAVGWGGAGGPGQWGVTYPHGYVPAQPGLVYPSGYPPPGVVSGQAHAPVIP